MKIAQRSTLDEFTSRTWEEFGQDIGVSGPSVRRRAAALAGRALDALPYAAEGIADAGFEGPGLWRIQDTIARRAQDLLDMETARARSTARQRI